MHIVMATALWLVVALAVCVVAALAMPVAANTTATAPFAIEGGDETAYELVGNGNCRNARGNFPNQYTLTSPVQATLDQMQTVCRSACTEQRACVAYAVTENYCSLFGQGFTDGDNGALGGWRFTGGLPGAIVTVTSGSGVGLWECHRKALGKIGHTRARARAHVHVHGGRQQGAVWCV